MVRYLPYRWGGRRAERNLLFHLWGHTPGVHTLSPFLTINGQTEEPFFRYKGGDASLSGWPDWTYGVDLDYYAGTAPDFDQKGPALGSMDFGVKFNQGAYFRDESDTIDVSTEDFVLEIIYSHFTSGQSNFIGTKNDGGWMLYTHDSDDRLSFVAKGSETVKAKSVYPTYGQYLYVMIGWDRSENSDYSLSIYIDGVYVAGSNFYDIQDVSGNTYFFLGGLGAYAHPGHVFYTCGWKKNNWLPGGASNKAEMDVIAAERFHRWSGMWPTKAVGTWAPTVATRAFGAYLENQDAASPYTRRIYQVGSEHLRVQRAMINGSRFIGYRPEPQTTNLIPESEDLATTWAATRCSISQDAIDTPDGDGRTVVDGIVASVDDDTHYVEITPPFADGETHCVSFNAKEGAVDGIKIEFMTSGGYAYFDLDSKTVESSFGLTAYIDDTVADDFCRCIVRETLSSADAMRLYPSEVGADESFAGDGASVSVYVWGIQAESGNYSATSLVNTDAATATRLADQARYKGDDGNVPAGGAGRLTMKVVFPEPVTDVAASIVPLASLSDGGAATDYIDLACGYTEAAYVAVVSAASGGSAGQSILAVDIRDGDVHDIEMRWKTDYLAVAVDGVWSTPDTDVDIPDDLDRIEPGTNHDGTYVAAGIIISDFKIYSWNG